ncbi:skin secretory protein xP2-like [Sorghum bicolor]|uniref:skin secretory protein xP2-like n=1 Tax=Sorghum bicolor TaxID=4558 RepID=UPI000B424BB2|nr:skin secretory protein xP2-like [Sorghum bicolor]|eukprot:XP_021321346.1 skin secretory protein xP2-like [Sorghum bicolor]
MSPVVLEKTEVQQLMNELFNFIDDNFIRNSDRMHAFKLGRPAPKCLTLVRCHVSASAASDVDPDNVAGQRTAEPAAVVGDAAQQTAQEQPEERPAATTAAKSSVEQPAPAKSQGNTPAGDEEAARAPPPSSAAEEEDRVPTPPPAEEGRVPTPPRAGASSPVDSPGLDQGPVMPATMAGGSAEGEETQTASDNEVEEIQVLKVNTKKHFDELIKDRDSWKANCIKI